MQVVMRAILVTGCSSGIGLHCARRLAGEGWRVFASARRDADLAKLAETAEADRTANLSAVRMDLDDSESIRRGLAEVLEKSEGRLDALFNNAGYGQPGAVEDLTREAMRAQFETNVFGLLELTNLALPAMLEAGGAGLCRIHRCWVLRRYAGGGRIRRPSTRWRG